MSDETEKECRLTYAEGRKISMEAQKPYETATFVMIGGAFIILAAVGAYLFIDSVWGCMDYSSIDALLDRGEISGAVAEFLREEYRSSVISIGASPAIGSLFASMGFAVLGKYASKRALAEANDAKEGDADGASDS